MKLSHARTLAVVLGAVLAGREAGAQCSPPAPGFCRTDATGCSDPTLCAEEDNVNIPFTGKVASFVVEATHPAYAVGVDSCAPDFTDCPPPGGGYPFPPAVIELFNDGITIVEAVREASWWRPPGMTASADAGPLQTDIHYVRVYRKIADADEWPQFFVLYMDGNLRLVPQPPLGRSAVCFGSSVVIGPATPAPRPLAEIGSVRYLSATRTLAVNYLAGGSAVLSLSEVDRVKARVQVTVDYPTDSLPFATFRSMFVANGNADVDHVAFAVLDDLEIITPIMGFSGSLAARAFFFHREVRSQHNTSAPDIRIAGLVNPCPAAYHTLTPCRVVDTRQPDGTYGGPALAAGAVRVFPLFGQCGIPSSAKAVAANLTVTQPSTTGHLTLFPAGNPVPPSSSINYAGGRTRANNGIFSLSAGGPPYLLPGLAVFCGQPSGTTHFILDVYGYLE